LGQWRLAGQGLIFRYHWLTATGFSATGPRPDGAVTARFSRGARPDEWIGEAPDYAATLRIEGGAGAGVRLLRLDGDGAEIPARVEEAGARLLVWYEGRLWVLRRAPRPDTDRLNIAAHVGEDRLEAPMPGKIIQVLVAEGDEVTEGQQLVVMEAMKMEFTIKAPHDGRVTRAPVRVGQLVEAGAELVEVTA
jgi:biotin carboxyl carrier protein